MFFKNNNLLKFDYIQVEKDLNIKKITIKWNVSIFVVFIYKSVFSQVYIFKSIDVGVIIYYSIRIVCIKEIHVKDFFYPFKFIHYWKFIQ
jgi:hypothetical protein